MLGYKKKFLPGAMIVDYTEEIHRKINYLLLDVPQVKKLTNLKFCEVIYAQRISKHIFGTKYLE